MHHDLAPVLHGIYGELRRRYYAETLLEIDIDDVEHPEWLSRPPVYPLGWPHVFRGKEFGFAVADCFQGSDSRTNVKIQRDDIFLGIYAWTDADFTLSFGSDVVSKHSMKAGDFHFALDDMFMVAQVCMQYDDITLTVTSAPTETPVRLASVHAFIHARRSLTPHPCYYELSPTEYRVTKRGVMCRETCERPPHPSNIFTKMKRLPSRNAMAVRIQAAFRGWRVRHKYRYDPHNRLGFHVIRKMFEKESD